MLLKCGRNICSSFNNDSVAYMSIEGNANEVLEIAFILVKSGELTECKVFHAYPEDMSRFLKDRKHSHNLNVFILKQQAFESQIDLYKAVRYFLYKNDIRILIGLDSETGKQSENHLFLRNIGYCDYVYHSHNLPSWIERSKFLYHAKAMFLKNNSIPIQTKSGECKCVAHDKNIVISKGSPVTRELREKYDFHCSLYKCYESYLYHTNR